MFVMDCYGHKLSSGVLFAHHLILDAPGGSSHLGYRRRVPPGHNPHTGVKHQGTADKTVQISQRQHERLRSSHAVLSGRANTSSGDFER